MEGNVKSVRLHPGGPPVEARLDKPSSVMVLVLYSFVVEETPIPTVTLVPKAKADAYPFTLQNSSHEIRGRNLDD